MRLTQAVCAQHIGNWFKRKWYHARNCVPKETGAAAALQKHNVNVVDGFKFIYPEQPSHIP